MLKVEDRTKDELDKIGRSLSAKFMVNVISYNRIIRELLIEHHKLHPMRKKTLTHRPAKRAEKERTTKADGMASIQ